MAAQRETLRKRLIRTVLQERKALLLEELRWEVLRREADERGKTMHRLERSQLVSFARTAREHFSIKKVPISGRTTIGLVARCAAYRIQERDDLEAFLSGDAPTVVCQYRTNFPVDAPRYTRRYVIPQHHMLLFDFFENEASQAIAHVKVPATHRLTIVSLRPRLPKLTELGRVPWRLFGRGRVGNWPYTSAGPRFRVKASSFLDGLL